MLVASALFIVTLLLAPRRGLVWQQWSQHRRQQQAVDDDLLKDILLAEREDGLVPDAALLGQRLTLTPETTGRGLARLARAGLLRLPGQHVALTSEGELRASELVRTQRLLETYLHDVEEVPLENIRAQADHREHTLSADAVEAMAHLLGEPSVDPHGHRIPQREEVLRRIAGQSLAATAPGQSGRVTMISDDRADLVGEMARLGILPDASITVLALEPAGLRVRIDKQELAGLRAEIARRVFVMPRPRIVSGGVA